MGSAVRWADLMADLMADVMADVMADLCEGRKKQQKTWWMAYALLLVLAPLLWTGSLSHSLLGQIGIAIIACLSYNMLLGQGGMISFGHAVYSGMGAFFAIHMLNGVSNGWAWPVSLLPLAGGLGSAVLALLLGWVSTQQTGLSFAMMTLGIGELLGAFALMFPQFFGGEAGMAGNRVAGNSLITLDSSIALYYLVACHTFVCTALMYAFTRTPLGRMLVAVRDNPERVAFLGYNPHRVRYLTFVVAAFFAGVSGGLAALHFEMVTVDVLSTHRSGTYLLFTFLGGSTFFFGPIIGAVLMVLAYTLLSEWTPAWLLYLGLSFVVMVIYAPGGVASLIMEKVWMRPSDIRRFAGRTLAMTATALVALTGAAAMIEMLYHLQQSAGPQLRFLKIPLNARDVDCWLGAVLVMWTGLCLFALTRHHCQHDPEQMTSAP